MPAAILKFTRCASIAFVLAVAALAIACHPARARSADSFTDRFETTINESIELDLLANDPPDATVVDFSRPGHGSVTRVENGLVRYLPAANFTGQDSFTYQMQAPSAEPKTVDVLIAVSGKATSVEARNDRAATDEDVPVAVTVLSNDAPGPSGSTLIATIENLPSHGTAAVQPDGSILYVPAPDWSGEDTFTYIAADGSTTDSAKAVITISAAPDGPDAVDDEVRMRQDGTTAIDLLANDSDPEGDAFVLTASSQPLHGSATWSDADRMIIYSPAAGYWGQDEFNYTITDNDGSDSATVTIVIDGAPLLADDAIETLQGTAVTLDVLANDADPESATLIMSGVTTPVHGTAVINPDMTITYQPDKSFVGTDEFEYSVADGGRNARSATVTVTVSRRGAGNAVAAADDEFLVQEDSPGNTLDLVSNDTHPEAVNVIVAVDTTPEHGTVTVDALQVVTYVPLAEFSGRDSFTYSLVDPSGERSAATVTIEVQGVNDEPVAVPDSATGAEDSRIEIDVLANDTDIDLDALVVDSVAKPAHGKARVTKDGAIAYTPAPDYVGTDELLYVVSDGRGGTSSAVVAVMVSAVNDPPNAANDRQKTGIDEAIVIDIVANDSDPDDPYLSVTVIAAPRHGTVALTAANTIYYAPAPGFEGVDSFKYQISDGESVDTATVRVTVGKARTKPKARDDSATTRAESPVVIDTTANDDDPSGGKLKVKEVSQPRHGKVIVEDEEVTYIPESGYVGVDSFGYTVQDENGETDTATVEVDVASPRSKKANEK